MGSTQQSLSGLLRPRSVAIIGASPRDGAFGNSLRKSVGSLGYPGRTSLINPKYTDIDGEPCYPDLASLPERPDCALIAVGDQSLVKSLEAVAERGIPGAVLFGRAHGMEPDGATRADALAAIGRSAKMAICGANCMGFVNLRDRLQITGLPFKGFASPSGVALVTHSGSTWSGLVGNQRQIGFDFAISAGQELVTNVSDYVDYLLRETPTRVIACVLETIRDPEGFMRAAELANERNVPIVVLKLGRSEAGKQFAVSHSGAISGSNAAYDAVFERHGIIRVRTLDELLDTVELLAMRRRPSACGLAIGTDSGGERQLIVDIAADVGLTFPSLGRDTVTRINALLDPGMEASNPLDYWGDGANVMAPCLAAMADDPAVGMVVMATNIPPDRPFTRLCATAIREVHEATEKPVALMGNVTTTMSTATAAELRREGIPVLMGTESSVRALKHYLDYAYRRRIRTDAGRETARPSQGLSYKVTRSDHRTLTSATGFEALAEYGIRSAPFQLVSTREEAVRFGTTNGYPIVLKLDDPRIPHKSDVGGVRLGLSGHDEVVAAFDGLHARHPHSPILAQRQVKGVELILGMTTDLDFGPIITLGLGGVFTEIFKDARALVPPFDEDEALRAVQSLKGFPLLTGARGGTPADLVSLCATISAFSRFARDLSPLLTEIEINPLMAGPDGAVAVDCLAVRHLESPNG